MEHAINYGVVIGAISSPGEIAPMSLWTQLNCGWRQLLGLRGLAVVQFRGSRALDSHVSENAAAIGQLRPSLARA